MLPNNPDKPSPRDPRIDPRPGDVLLEKDKTHPLVVGPETTPAKPWFSYGVPNYYWVPIATWRARHLDSMVIYTNPAPPEPIEQPCICALPALLARGANICVNCGKRVPDERR